jgi:hypothetical protein
VLVDIRKASEVDSKGSPTMPKGQAAKLVRVEFDTIAGAYAGAAALHFRQLPTRARPVWPSLLT